MYGSATACITQAIPAEVIISGLLPFIFAATTTVIMMTALHVELASPVIIPYSTITHTETIPGITFEPLILLSSLNNVIPIIAMWTPDIANICAIPLSWKSLFVSRSIPLFSPRSIARITDASLTAKYLSSVSPAFSLKL